nr:M15 family metallopeptidase [Eubacterium sp.]
MKRFLRIGIILFFVFAASIILNPAKPQHQSEDNNTLTYEYYYNDMEDEEDSLLPEDLSSILADNQTVPLDTIPSSKTVLVNRKYLLPSTYVPAHLVEPKVRFSFSYSSDKRKMRKVAADALERLFKAGEKEGVILYGVSGYRSYARQKQIYDRNVATRGVEATNAVSAKPGSSEHQTGLTIDVSAKSVAYRLDQSFGDTKEGKWLAKHAHLYGYIIRYPYGKAKITGYSYEPWHIRFVGKTVATYLYENNMTMEEYYGVAESMKKETEKEETKSRVDVEDPDSVTYATPKPKKKPKEKSEKEKKSKTKKKDKDSSKKTENKPTTTAMPTSTKAPEVSVPAAPAAPSEPEKPAAPVEPTKAPVSEPVPPTPLPEEDSSSQNEHTGQ